MTLVVTSTSATTALTIIKRSLRLLGVYATGEEPSADEAQDCLSALNSLMGSLSNEPLLIHARSLDEIALAAGTDAVTVGPSGDKVTDRPVKVLTESYIQYGDVSYPLEVLTLEQYNAIGIKELSSIPRGIYAQMDMPNVTLYLWPQPDQAMTLMLWSDKLLASFPGLTSDVRLPPGYDRMLAFLLAIDLAPEYQVQPPAAVVQGAASARRALKRTNAEVPQMDMPYGVPGGRCFRDIREF